MKKVAKTFLIRFVFLTVFVLVTGFAVMQTLGYQYSLKYGFSKTSIVDLRADLGEIDVYLDGDLVSNISPFEIGNVPLGRHNLEFRKQGYENKIKEIDVEEGLVTRVDYVFLVPSEKKTLPIADNLVDWSRKRPEFLSRSVSDKVYSVYSYEDGKIAADHSFVRDDLDYSPIEFADDGAFHWYGDESYNLLRSPYVSSESFDIRVSEARKYRYSSNLDKLVIWTKDDELRIVSPHSDDEPVKLIENVDLNFWLRGRQMVALSSDNLRVIDLVTGKIIREWSGEFASSKNDQAYKGDALLFDDSVLLWLPENGALSFFEGDTVTEIAMGVQSITDISPNGDFLMLKGDGEIVLYNLKTREQEFVTRYASDKLALSWYVNPSHFWILSEDSARICDIEDGICDLLFADLDDSPFYYPENNLLLIEKDGEAFLHPVEDGQNRRPWWRWI